MIFSGLLIFDNTLNGRADGRQVVDRARDVEGELVQRGEELRVAFSRTQLVFGVEEVEQVVCDAAALPHDNVAIRIHLINIITITTY